MSSEIVTLDVRDDIRNGGEPFSKIMSAVARLRPDENLLLVAPFEPIPLFHVLAGQGFGHEARQTESGDWEVLFTRNGESHAPERRPPARRESRGPEYRAGSETVAPIRFVEVDARDLEPPLPMIRILEALAGLPAGVGLRARTDRRPMHLYAQLEARGFAGETEEQSDGSYVTHIRPR